MIPAVVRKLIASPIFIGILVLVINKWWDPFAGYLGYPFDVRRRVKDLEDAVDKLCRIQADLDRLDPRPSSERGKGWVQSVQDLRVKAKEIKIGLDECRLNYFSRCYFGKQAGEELKKATDLETRGNSLLQEARAKPHTVRRVLLQQHRDQLRGFDSYKEKVLKFIDLKHGAPSQPLGIWGMGGVGKTALLNFVGDTYAGRDAFNHVLPVVAGRGCTVAELQGAIATKMGLPVVKDDVKAQEHIIWNHLQDKNFLLLVDDLWERLDLEAVGIPMPLGEVMVSREGDRFHAYQRKVVFTTRSQNVCGQMECHSNDMKLKCLSKIDAWNLFTDKVGSHIVNGTQIRRFAEKIVHGCNGLPAALCIIGRTMSTKKSVQEWRSAVDLLESTKIYEIMNKDDDLFARLKLSYDNMADDMKNCFLVCALWSGDENIPMEKLVEWWIGLGLLDVPKPIYRGYSIIKDLVRQSMLENADINLYSTEKRHVKIHEVIRQMSLHIVNDPQDRLLPLSFCRSTLSKEKWCTVERAWISPRDSSSWSKNPTSFCFPRLTMLVSRNPFSLRVIPHFKAITFLDMGGTEINEFPAIICELVNLQYLNLSATRISGLPVELKKLSNLKFLCFRDTAALETIPEGIISQLTKLQGLDLFCSGVNSHMVKYLSPLLKELANEIVNLLVIGITVHTRADITELGQLDHVCTQALCMQHFVDGSHLDRINLHFVSYCLDSLRELTIMDSSETLELVAEGVEMVAEGDPNSDNYSLFQELEFLELRNLLKLKNVAWKNAGTNIRVVVIYNCAELKEATWLHHLQSLEELTIACCAAMDKVIDNVEEANQMAFSNLKKLYLEQLPKLSVISAQGFPFKGLSYAFVARCENLKIIQVEQGSNQHQIKVECDEDWWKSSVQNQVINNPLFVPTFSWLKVWKHWINNPLFESSFHNSVCQRKATEMVQAEALQTGTAGA